MLSNATLRDWGIVAEDGNARQLSVEQLLAAMVALQMADRDERLTGAEPRRTELVLADAGVGLADIARLTGRPYDTVKTAVRRAREKARTFATAGRKKGVPGDD
jgi:DNA-directed RNA polymerase specialized sigma24 family protein